MMAHSISIIHQSYFYTRTPEFSLKFKHQFPVQVRVPQFYWMFLSRDYMHIKAHKIKTFNRKQNMGNGNDSFNPHICDRSRNDQVYTCLVVNSCFHKGQLSLFGSHTVHKHICCFHTTTSSLACEKTTMATGGLADLSQCGRCFYAF